MYFHLYKLLCVLWLIIYDHSLDVHSFHRSTSCGSVTPPSPPHSRAPLSWSQSLRVDRMATDPLLFGGHKPITQDEAAPATTTLSRGAKALTLAQLMRV